MCIWLPGCMQVCACTWACGNPRWPSGVFLDHFPHYSLSRGLSLDLMATLISQLVLESPMYVTQMLEVQSVDNVYLAFMKVLGISTLVLILVKQSF